MATQKIGSFDLTQDQLNQITSDGTGVSIEIVYDDTPPEGYEVIARGPLGVITVCAKPCNSFNFQ